MTMAASMRSWTSWAWGTRNKSSYPRTFGTKRSAEKYGGWGYAHILDNTLPVMRAKGMSEEDIRILMIDNPARLFSFA